MNILRKARLFSFLVIFSLLLSLAGTPVLHVKAAATITFTGEELLGKPEDDSITINIVPASTIEYHYQYGLTAGANTWSTANVTATGGQPSEVTITGLTANTQYFYRMQYHAPGDAMNDWVNRTEHYFWTQRAPGSSFIFTVTSDSHQNFNTNEQNAMTNILNEHPDFHIDLGDTFLLDGSPDQSSVFSKYLAYREPLYFDKMGNSRTKRAGTWMIRSAWPWPASRRASCTSRPRSITTFILQIRISWPPSMRPPTATSTAKITTPGHGAMRYSW
jgi:hypothetical protein